MSSASTFLQKLLTMIEDPKSDQHIAWSADGTSFFVFDSMLFSKEMLPQYFRHNKFASFVRQLNMYDFHKVPIDTTGRLFSENAVQFTNPYFVRGQPHLLQNMKRKAGTRIDKAETSESEKDYIVAALANLARSEQQIHGKLSGVESDNQYLKEEFSKLCQKNTQQEQTVNKIMQFLTSVYGPNGESSTTTLSTSQTVPNIQYPQHSSTNSPLTFAALDTRIGDNFSPVSQPGQQQNWVG